MAGEEIITPQAPRLVAAMGAAAGGRMSAEGAGRDEREFNTGREAAEGRKVSPCLLASGRKLEKLEDVEELKLRREKGYRKTNSS